MDQVPPGAIPSALGTTALARPRSPPRHLQPPGSRTRCPAASPPPRLEHHWLPASRISLATPRTQPLARPPPLTCGHGRLSSPPAARLCPAPSSLFPAQEMCCLTLTHAPAPCLSQLIPLPVLLLLLNISRWLPALPEPQPAGAGAPGQPRAPAGLGHSGPARTGHHTSLRLSCLATIPRVEGTAGP